MAEIASTVWHALGRALCPSRVWTPPTTPSGADSRWTADSGPLTRRGYAA